MRRSGLFPATSIVPAGASANGWSISPLLPVLTSSSPRISMVSFTYSDCVLVERRRTCKNQPMEGPPKRSNEAENDYGTTKPWDPLALIAQVKLLHTVQKHLLVLSQKHLLVLRMTRQNRQTLLYLSSSV